MDLLEKRHKDRIRRMKTEQRKKEQGYKPFSIYLNPENTAYLNQIKIEISTGDKPSTNSQAIEHIFNICRSKQ